MKDKLSKNRRLFVVDLSDVLGNIVGTIGIVYIILFFLFKFLSFVNKNLTDSLCNYFKRIFSQNKLFTPEKNKSALFEIERNEFINSDEIKKNIEQVQLFNNEIDNLKKSFIRYSSKVAISKKYENLFKKLSSAEYKTYKIADLDSFCQTYSQIHRLVAKWNKSFIEAEMLSRRSLFDNIDGKRLDQQQRKAVIVDEDNNLVLAGAGSGKTLTIAAKVKYLVENKNINPKDILLISFTRKAAKEMQERISNKLNIDVEAMTFHKLGLEICQKINGSRPDVFTDLKRVVDNYFRNEILTDQNAVKNIIEFFGLYFNTPTNYDTIECLGQVIERENHLDLETIKSKVETKREEWSKQKKTFQGERVKSIEEAMIANHLYLNGVSYKYERLYPYETENKFKKRYRPDFYLQDYDLYLEHFGIDKNGQVPWLPQIEAKKYIDDMKWKRDLHRSHGTKLLETYSYFNKYGRLLIELDNLLQKNGIKYKQVDYLEIFKKIVIAKDDRTYSEFLKLVVTFINLFKSNGYDEKSFSMLEGLSDKQTNNFIKYREKMFLSIVEPLFIQYQNMMKENDYIDFNDMINLSTSFLEEGKIETNYKYIIVDEYQDISVSRFRLIKAIKDKTNAILMAVGDDWQSIYRFSGSDIDLFTSFNNYVGHTEKLKVEKTYRNAQDLIDIASKFILKNPKQLKKRLISDKNKTNPLKIILYKKDVCEAVMFAIENIVTEYGEKSNVLILGRNNYDIEALQDNANFIVQTETDKIKVLCKRYSSLEIEFLTVHKSKGLEADNVIVINMENKLSGFPNKIVDDPILSLVLSNSDKYEYAEERRLLYVAMTRTKNFTYFLAPDESKSCFIRELINDNKNIYYQNATTEEIISKNPKCPRCQHGTLILRKNIDGKTFLACSNYPRCDKTYNNTEILYDTVICDVCNDYMVKRQGTHGEFYGCTNYPVCDNTINNINVNTSCNLNTEGDKERLSERRIQRIKQYPPDKRFPWADKGLRRTGKRKSRNW